MYSIVRDATKELRTAEWELHVEKKRVAHMGRGGEELPCRNVLHSEDHCAHRVRSGVDALCFFHDDEVYRTSETLRRARYPVVIMAVGV